MNRYRVFTPNGHVGTMEMNAAAVAQTIARPGWAVELIGPSLITIVDEPDED